MQEDVNTGTVKWVALIIIAITSSVITFMMSAVMQLMEPGEVSTL